VASVTTSVDRTSRIRPRPRLHDWLPEARLAKLDGGPNLLVPTPGRVRARRRDRHESHHKGEPAKSLASSGSSSIGPTVPRNRGTPSEPGADGLGKGLPAVVLHPLPVEQRPYANLLSNLVDGTCRSRSSSFV
jgi:hypothetical protein